jgi:hypothetical protein
MHRVWIDTTHRMPLRPCLHLTRARAWAVVRSDRAGSLQRGRPNGRSWPTWMTETGMIQAGASAALDTWIGWYRPYATSREDLDAD